MESFSQRKGLKPVKSVMQVDSVDNDLRNGLWNALTIYYWDQIEPSSVDSSYNLSSDSDVEALVRRLWLYYFKKLLDTLRYDWSVTYDEIRSYFFKCSWYEIYDLTEFVAKSYPGEYQSRKFMTYCNSVLEREVSAFRFVGGKITQITSEEEITEIEQALEGGPKTAKTHLKTALELLSDRTSPDYRNSIKESISAVEAVCKKITHDDKATLDQALRGIETKAKLHPALKKAFSCLYGYTSDADGIRHALKDQTSPDVEDARFMLVSCSAFVNYLLAKASKANIKL